MPTTTRRRISPKELQDDIDAFYALKLITENPEKYGYQISDNGWYQPYETKTVTVTLKANDQLTTSFVVTVSAKTEPGKPGSGDGSGDGAGSDNGNAGTGADSGLPSSGAAVLGLGGAVGEFQDGDVVGHQHPVGIGGQAEFAGGVGGVGEGGFGHTGS